MRCKWACALQVRWPPCRLCDKAALRRWPAPRAWRNGGRRRAFRRRGRDIVHLAARNHQGVAFRHGIDVEKRVEVFVFRAFIGRDSPAAILLKIVMVYRYLLWRVGAESGGALRFRKYTKKQRNVGGLSRKKTPFPAFPASGKRAGAPSGEKADNLSPHFGGEHDACSLHSGESWGEERESGAFSSRVERFSFLLPTFAGRLRVSSHFAPVCVHSASFLIFTFIAALSSFNLLIFSVLWVKALPSVVFILSPCESKR